MCAGGSDDDDDCDGGEDGAVEDNRDGADELEDDIVYGFEFLVNRRLVRIGLQLLCMLTIDCSQLGRVGGMKIVGK